MTKKLLGVPGVVCAFAIVVGWSAPAGAQPVITSSSGQVVAAGPDFASDVLSDPWDFANVQDVGPFPDEFPGWSISGTTNKTVGRSVFITGGNFTGTTVTGGSNLIPLLYRGGADFITSATERNGRNDHEAIPTARYGKLAVRMNLSADTALNSQLAAFWYSGAYGTVGAQAYGVAFRIPKGGTRIYLIDMVTGIWTDERGNPATPTFLPVGGFSTINWNGASLMRGLQLRPTSDGTAQVDVAVDWVRLTQRDGQSGVAAFPLTFTGCNTEYNVEVESASGVWDVIHIGTANTSGGTTATVNYGVLPPGTWNLRVACFTPLGQFSARHPNTGPPTLSSPISLVINAPPTVTVIDPDATGGSDYATDVLGNPWDMATLSDVALATGIVAGSASIVTDAGSPAYQASTAAGTAGHDPQLTLVNGGTSILSTRKYRNVTFTLTLDTPFGLDGNAGFGSLARVFWGSQTGQDASSMTTTQDILIWPGRNTYTVDLNALTLANGGLETECVAPNPTNCPQIPWSQRSARFFRIDPHEASAGMTFRLGRVLLTTPDEVQLGNTFAVQYAFADADARGGTNIYRANIKVDVDRDTSAGLQTLASNLTVTPGVTQTYAFDPQAAGLSAAEYFVYIEIVETRGSITETRGAYSTGTIRVYTSASTSPQTSVTSPTSGSTQPTPFTVSGCAYDQGNTTGINVDDLAAYAIAGSNITGPQAGTTQVLGFGNTLGVLAYAPLTPSTPVVCPSITNTGSPFRNSGFSITDITGLSPGNWTLRLITRSTISGDFTQNPDVPFSVINTTGAPENFNASASGNVVTISFTAPTTGPAVGGYVVDAANNENFSPTRFSVPVPSAGTYSGSLENGAWYFRVVSLAPGGARGASSPTRSLVLPGGGGIPAPPGPAVLNAPVVSGNNVTLTWVAGSGGAPTSYSIIAGSTAGSSNIGTFPMGTSTSISATVGNGAYFVRIVATNISGSATSNERSFTIGATSLPGVPTLNQATVSNRNVTMTWTTPSGSPTAYTILARLSATGAIIASLPVTGNTVTVPAPPGTYFVTITASNSLGSSAESNQITIIVP